MAIREKLRAKFSSKNKTTQDTSPSEPVEGHYTGRTDIEYYKPNEIPRSKYRGRVDKAHQEKLDAFSFFDAFQQEPRRASAALSGTFSPGGTKAFSRRTSYASNAGMQTPARSRRSSLSSDANDSFSVPSSDSGSTHIENIMAAKKPVGPTLPQSTEDDTDAANTAVTRIGTVQDSQQVPIVRLDRQATVTESQSSPSTNHIEHKQSSEELPFSPTELTEAMTRATITPQITARRTSVVVV